MSVGAVLTQIFDIVWLLSMLCLGAATAWLVFLMLRDIRELKALLRETTEDSTRAIELLANAISHMELLLAANLPQAVAPTKPASTKPTKPKTAARTSSTTRQAARQ